MIFIFLMSSKDAVSSTQISGNFIRKFAMIFIRNFSETTKEFQDEFIAGCQFFVRKGAHFSVYLLLGISVSGFWQTFDNISARIKALFSALIPFLYACSDELHQTLIKGRSGEFRDVMIDLCGIFCGIVFFYIFKKFYVKKFKITE